MWFKRIIGLIVSSLFLFNCVFFHAGALERQTYEGSSQDIMLCASGQFSVMIPGKKLSVRIWIFLWMLGNVLQSMPAIFRQMPV